jgi:hypothetical protein
MGIPSDNAAGRRQFEQAMEVRRRENEPERYAGIRRGWCWGDDAFRKELLHRMESAPAGTHFGEAVTESATEKAERLLKAELVKLGWGSSELESHRKGDPDKVRIAARLRSETTMTLKWIADHLRMGTASSLANLLAAQRRSKG